MNEVNNWFRDSTRRPGNVRLHVKFRPRSSTFLASLSTKGGTRWKPPGIQLIFNKLMYEQKYRLQRKYFNGVKNAALNWWDMSLLRKWGKTNNKIKQHQQQKLIISKLYVHFFKKLKNKVKIASNKTETEQDN